MCYLTTIFFVDIDSYTKYQWKRVVKKIICKLNKDELVKMSKKYKKIDYKYDDNLEARHSYLTEMKLHDARLLFKIRSQMVPLIQMNFRSDKTFTANQWTCSACKANRDTQSHVISCVGYNKFRDGLNLDDEGDLVKYFRTIINLRTSS